MDMIERVSRGLSFIPRMLSDRFLVAASLALPLVEGANLSRTGGVT